MKFKKFIPLSILTYLTPVLCSSTEIKEASTSLLKNPWFIGGAVLVVVVIAAIVYYMYGQKSK